MMVLLYRWRWERWPVLIVTVSWHGMHYLSTLCPDNAGWRLFTYTAEE